VKRVLLCGCALVALGCSVAKAQSGEMRKAMLDYPLTLDRANDLLAAMGPMTKHVLSLPNAGETIRAYQSLPLDERIARTEKDADAMAILRQHHLTARDYIVGVPALRSALSAAAGGEADANVSPANLAFAKANLTTLKPKMDAADGATRRPPRGRRYRSIGVLLSGRGSSRYPRLLRVAPPPGPQ
jgi:hypothetical protein